MPVQLDLFGSPLRPPKKIREDETPATAAPLEKDAEKPTVAESYVAIIHPKDNKQGWHTVTTVNEPEFQLLEEEEAAGVNEEAAIGEEAFEDDPEKADGTISPEEISLEKKLAEDERVTVTDEETAIEAGNAVEEEVETEGIESFSEQEIEELSQEETEKEPVEEEFTDNSSGELVDEESEAFIDEEPTVEEEGQEDEQENFIAEEAEEPAESEPENEEADVFSGQELDEAEKEALGETAGEIANEQETAATEAAETETEGTESFSEPEMPEADEPELLLDESDNEEAEIVDEEQANTDADGLVEDELVMEEESAGVNPPEVSAANTVVEEPVGKQRGRKPIQDYDDEAGNLNVPPDEDLFKRQYYSMRETAAMFGVNQSLLRFWENEFKILQPKKNKKGDRYFRPVDVKNLVLIYHLLRVRKFTMEGAKEYLQSNKKAGDAFELSKRLEKLKSFLLELKASL